MILLNINELVPNLYLYTMVISIIILNLRNLHFNLPNYVSTNLTQMLYNCNDQKSQMFYLYKYALYF